MIVFPFLLDFFSQAILGKDNQTMGSDEITLPLDKSNTCAISAC
jgi:hypothetical protein